MSGKISASMMCSDLIDLKETIKIFESEGVEYLHIDMMDGTFVPTSDLVLITSVVLENLRTYHLICI